MVTYKHALIAVVFILVISFSTNSILQVDGQQVGNQDIVMTNMDIKATLVTDCGTLLIVQSEVRNVGSTPNDYFVASDNGAGYCEPGMLQEPRGISGLPSGLDTWANHCKVFYDQWGLSVTGFIIYAHGPELNKAGFDCYESFSPNGIVPTLGYLSLSAFF